VAWCGGREEKRERIGVGAREQGAFIKRREPKPRRSQVGLRPCNGKLKHVRAPRAIPSRNSRVGNNESMLPSCWRLATRHDTSTRRDPDDLFDRLFLGSKQSFFIRILEDPCSSILLTLMPDQGMGEKFSIGSTTKTVLSDDSTK